jgi:hypothetical protein
MLHFHPSIVDRNGPWATLSKKRRANLPGQRWTPKLETGRPGGLPHSARRPQTRGFILADEGLLHDGTDTDRNAIPVDFVLGKNYAAVA